MKLKHFILGILVILCLLNTGYDVHKIQDEHVKRVAEWNEGAKAAFEKVLWAERDKRWKKVKMVVKGDVIKEEIKGSDAEKILEVGTPIDLRSLLTSDFFGKDITLEGFIGEDVVEGGPDDDGDEEVDIVYYEKVFWTLPAKIGVKEKVKDKDEYKTVDFIKIEVETADNGHDYSSEGIENPISENINSIDSQITSKEYFISK